MRSALLVVIVAVSACSGGTSDGHETSPTDALNLPDLTNRSVDVTTPVPTEQPQPGTAAPTPQEAVSAFVKAEIAGDTDASYDLLSAADRDEVRTRAGWLNVHSRLPRLTAFYPILSSEGTMDSGPTVVGDAEFEAQLDEIDGLIPARGSVTFSAIAEDGGWRVSYESTKIVPAYPSDQGATSAARTWLDSYRECRSPGEAVEYTGGLVGTVGIAAALCNAGPARIGEPERLGDRPNPAPVLAAFGSQADIWARVIDVTGPRSFSLVLAPLDERWIVIGVLADGL